MPAFLIKLAGPAGRNELDSKFVQTFGKGGNSGFVCDT